MLVLIPILSVLCGSGLWLALGRPRFVPRPAGRPDPAGISIIIPARNEENNIAILLESIRNQESQPHEVIVVDDDSSDRTAAIAAESGARVVQSPALPADWKGKTWACHHGAAQATGDCLLFLDADTRLEPGALSAFASLAETKERVASVCPYHQTRRPYEELSAFFNVIMAAGINAFGARGPASQNAALFGQCLLIPVPIYQQVGGHEAVRSEILENFSLSRHLRDQGIARDCYLGRGCITMRMFPSGLPELWASWKKGFTLGAGMVAPGVLAAVSIWLTGAMIASFSIALAIAPLPGTPFRLAALAAYLVHAALCLRAFRLVGGFSPWNALFFPVSLFFYQALFLTAIIERKFGIKTLWKGRHVD